MKKIILVPNFDVKKQRQFRAKKNLTHQLSALANYAVQGLNPISLILHWKQ